MSTLAQVLGHYVTRLTEGAIDELPLDGDDAAIRRKRGVRHGATAVVAVVGVGLLGAGGVAGIGYYESIQPPWYYLPDGGGTVQIAVDGPDPTIPDIGIKCGGPAPVAAPTADGFTAEIEANTNPVFYEESGYLDGRVRVTNSNIEEFPGFVLAPVIVVVKEGVVVAIENNYGLNQRLSFTPGRTTIPQDFSVAGWEQCGDTAGGHLPSGDYEYYVITTVANSPEMAALSRATDIYGQGPWFNGDKWLEPTDWECDPDTAQSIFGGWSSAAPACLPRFRPETTWDAQTRTVSLPYGDGQVTRVFSTHLVSGPYPYTTNGEFWNPQYPAADVTYPADDPTAPCGAELEQDEDRSEAYFASDNLFRALINASDEADVEVWLAFGPDGVESRTATVSMPGTSQALLTSWGTAIHDGYESGAELVVGRATVTVNRGRDIQISRATGPATVSVEIDDVVWCDGKPPSDAITVYVTAPFTVVGDNKQHQADWFAIYDWSNG